MPMPETAVDKNHLAPGGEDEVRLTGKVGVVKPEAVAEAVGEGADTKLDGGALGANAGHAFGPLWWGQGVHFTVVP